MKNRSPSLEFTVEFIQRDIKELREDLRAVKADVDGVTTRDFRLLFRAISTMALGLAGLISIGFHWL